MKEKAMMLRMLTVLADALGLVQSTYVGPFTMDCNFSSREKPHTLAFRGTCVHMIQIDS